MVVTQLHVQKTFWRVLHSQSPHDEHFAGLFKIRSRFLGSLHAEIVTEKQSMWTHILRGSSFSVCSFDCTVKYIGNESLHLYYFETLLLFTVVNTAFKMQIKSNMHCACIGFNVRSHNWYLIDIFDFFVNTVSVCKHKTRLGAKISQT